ncbi:MAG TPA: TonB-dependent receptor [Terriglobia bacterium]|nr:TonB-dependent receptor [Terriglobia bacterium]
MKINVLRAALLCVFAFGMAFSQGGTAQLGGVVTDQSGALIPGVTITVTNTDTGVTNNSITNESGAYNFPSLQPGQAYRVTATLPGFQTATVNNLALPASSTNRQNFQLTVAGTATSVDVQTDANAVITAAGASVGDVLPSDRIRGLPLVGNNVLDLLDILPGIRISPAGEQNNTVGGLGINSINVTRDGLPMRDDRFSAQGGTDTFGGYAGGYSLLATTTLNPDLIGEVRLILSPVDAELGRGNAQVQITTRSGTNRFSGTAVWNIQNTALNANTWNRNNDVDSSGKWNPTEPDWRNTHQYTLSFGGPIVRNKTFFFALWDQQITNTRQVQENRVLTDSARNGVFRFWEGWVGDSADPANFTTLPNLTANPTIPSVDFAGNPLRPEFWPDSSASSPKPYTGRLVCFSVFGAIKLDGSPFGPADCPSGTDSAGRSYTGVAMFPTVGSIWDSKRPSAAQAQLGYFGKIMARMPRANDFYSDANGDGLNYANFRRLLKRNGNNNNESIAGSEAYSDRKQINVKIDHNFTNNHRVNASWTYQLDDNADNVADWPDGLSGITYRRPQTLTINATSTLSPVVLNEARFGMNYNKTSSVPAWLSPHESTRSEAESFLVSGGPSRSGNGQIYPVVVAPATGAMIFNQGVMETCAQSACSGGLVTGVTQVSYSNPLYNVADTVSWTHGRHAFKFGGDFRFPRSDGFSLMPYPTATYGNLGGSTTESPFASSANSGSLGTTGTPSATNPAQVVNLFPQDARNFARDLSYVLTDSVGSIIMPYWADNATDVALGMAGWQDTTTQSNRFRKIVSSDFAIFAKDDYKLTRNMTLNLGVRYEYYSPPYITSGLTSTTVDQGDGLFGAARGAGSQLFNSWLQPGNLYLTGYGNNASRLAPGRTAFLECVPGVQQPGLPVSNCDPNLMTNIEFIGPNSPNASKTIIPRDRNNFGPAVGFSWQVPWFGEGKTTVRGGYQVTFSRVNIPDNTLASAIGGFMYQGLDANSPEAQSIIGTTQGNRAVVIGDVASLVPVTPVRAPGQTIPVYARSQAVASYDPNFATPYTQNLTLSVTRSLSRNLTLDVRYIGTLARKQASNLNLNTSTVFYNPELFDALERTRRGENVELFDHMLAGLDLVTAAGYGPIGTCSASPGTAADGYCGANTIRERGSEHLRRSSTSLGGGQPTVQQALANGNYVSLVNAFLAVNAQQGGYYGVTGGTTLPSGITTLSQRTLRNGCDRIANGLYNSSVAGSPTNIPTRCFSEDYLATNPQLTNATYNATLGRSNYHALQVQFTLRPTAGLSVQSTYSWAKSMQLSGPFTDPLMRDLDRQRGQEGPHSFRMNGTFELPVGPNRLFFGNTSGWVARVIEGWQTGFILNLATGSPASATGAGTMRYANARYNVTEFWKIPKGNVEWNGPGNNTGTFYGFDRYIGVRDPQCGDGAKVAQVDSRGYNFAGNCTLNALAARAPAGTQGSYELTPGDPASTVVNMLVNPAPGEFGTLGARSLAYWGQFNFDANLQKTFRITESKQLSIRVDATNILNHPQPAIPNFGATNFGTITGVAGDAKTGSRVFQGQARLTF